MAASFPKVWSHNVGPAGVPKLIGRSVEYEKTVRPSATFSRTR